MFVTSASAQEAQPAAGAKPAEGGAHAPAEGETHTEVGAHEGGHEAGFPPFDSTYYPSQLLWLAISFGLFYLFLKRVVLPRVGNILEVRRDRISQDLDQAARMKQEADAAIAAYEKDLADARTRANAIGQQARDKAKAEAEAERKQIEAGLEKKLAESEAHIASIKQAAMSDVGSIAEQTAGAIVEQLVGGSVDPAGLAAAVKAARE